MPFIFFGTKGAGKGEEASVLDQIFERAAWLLKHLPIGRHDVTLVYRLTRYSR